MAKRKMVWTGKNPDGSSLLGEMTDRARTICGKILSLKASGKISAEIDALGTTVKEKTNTRNKICKESAGRENRNCTRW